MNYHRVAEHLEDKGILLLSDKNLPSVVRLVAGPGIKGSWWANEKGGEIWRTLKRLEADPDVLVTRLVSGKVTYLHRRLWTDFLTVATSREPWQTKGLSPPARHLLSAISKEGEIRMDRYALGKDRRALGVAVGDIERRLLAYSDEVHTEKGSHAKILATWSRCPKLRGGRVRIGDVAAAKRRLESSVDRLTAQHGGVADLPWRKTI